jgi:hypothetical protein
MPETVFGKLDITADGDCAGDRVVETVIFCLVVVAHEYALDTMSIELDPLFLGYVDKSHAAIDVQMLEIRRVTESRW